MIIHFNISILLITVLFAFLVDNSGKPTIHNPHFSTKSKVCGKFINKKLSDALFQDVRVLLLNCDSSFSYKHSNCIHPETSSGTWTMNNDTINLSVTTKVKRLAKKEQKTKDGFRYLDLDNTHLTMNDSLIIWKRSDKYIDTLYRQ